jgi:hypothetical protein
MAVAPDFHRLPSDPQQRTAEPRRGKDLLSAGISGDACRVSHKNQIVNGKRRNAKQITKIHIIYPEFFIDRRNMPAYTESRSGGGTMPQEKMGGLKT